MSVLNVLKFEKSDSQQFLDARGPRFGAAITTALLALLLITQSWVLLSFIFTVALSSPHLHLARFWDQRRRHMHLSFQS